jgi:hypothetical protein
MTALRASGTINVLMLYVLALIMLIAACILALGYAGRDQSPDSTRGEEV